MPGVSINDIKSRIKSVESTMQITKAMELVATSKLRGAKARAEGVKPYLKLLKDAMLALGEEEEKAREGKELIILVAGDRGLAGGYNNNLFKIVGGGKENAVYLPIGKKAVDFVNRRSLPSLPIVKVAAQDFGVGTAMTVAASIYELITSSEISSVTVIYTTFVNMLTQTPKIETVYPIEGDKNDFDPVLDTDRGEILKAVIPQYIGGYIYGAVSEAVASECAARRTAMNAANKNAEEMIENLTLSFNRARQAVITQEITEIVSGAEAL